MHKLAFPIILSAFLADQLAKIITAYFLDRVEINAIGPFSLGISNSNMIIASGLLLLTLCLGIVCVKSKTAVFGISLMIGGGVSNIFDRILFQGVRDLNAPGGFLINSADIFIILGALLALLRPVFNVLNSKIASNK